jgi:hypothetical protein
MEECQCPPQIPLLGVMDLLFCLLLNFAIYLEEKLSQNPDQLYLLLEGVSTGGWCASKLGMGPEYPGLDESVEYARWRILHWIQ